MQKKIIITQPQPQHYQSRQPVSQHLKLGKNFANGATGHGNNNGYHFNVNFGHANYGRNVSQDKVKEYQCDKFDGKVNEIGNEELGFNGGYFTGRNLGRANFNNNNDHHAVDDNYRTILGARIENYNNRSAENSLNKNKKTKSKNILMPSFKPKLGEQKKVLDLSAPIVGNISEQPTRYAIGPTGNQKPILDLNSNQNDSSISTGLKSMLNKFPFREIEQQIQNQKKIQENFQISNINLISPPKEKIRQNYPQQAIKNSNSQNKSNSNNKNNENNYNQVPNTNATNINNNQQSHHITTLLTLQQKIRQLRLSQSIQPIVQPYRDRSMDSYFYGQDRQDRKQSPRSGSSSMQKMKGRLTGVGVQDLANKQSDINNLPHLTINLFSPGQSPSPNKGQARKSQKLTIINNNQKNPINNAEENRNGKGTFSKYQETLDPSAKKRMSLSLEAEREKERQRFIQRQKLQQKVAIQLMKQRQLRQLSQYQLKKKMKQITQKSEQLQKSVQDQKDKLKETKQKKSTRANINQNTNESKEKQQNIIKNIKPISKLQEMIKLQPIKKQINKETKQNKGGETQAQKCAKITLIYQPFSLNLSSNHKKGKNSQNSTQLQPNPQPQPKIITNYDNTSSKTPKKQQPQSAHYTQINNSNYQQQLYYLPTPNPTIPTITTTTQNKLQKIRNTRILRAYGQQSNIGIQDEQGQVQGQKFVDQDKWDIIVKEKRKVYQAFDADAVGDGATDKEQYPKAMTNTNNKINTKNTIYRNINNIKKQQEQQFPEAHTTVRRQGQQYDDQEQRYQGYQDYQDNWEGKYENQQDRIYDKQQNEEQDGSQQFCLKMKKIADYFNKKSQLERGNVVKQFSEKSIPSNANAKGRIKYSQTNFKNININLDNPHISSNPNPNSLISSLNPSFSNPKPTIHPSSTSQMKYSYSFQQENQDQYRVEKQLFNKFLSCKQIQWLVMYEEMVKVVGSYGKDQRQGKGLLTFVKIGDNGQTIYENRIIAHYIGIWLMRMGFYDNQVRQRLVNNVELMFTDMEDVIANDCQKMKGNGSRMIEQEEQEDYQGNIKQIAGIMYTNLLYGYLPGELQLRALLQVCRRGWQYFTFLIYKILKQLLKLTRKSNPIQTPNQRTPTKKNSINFAATTFNLPSQQQAQQAQTPYQSNFIPQTPLTFLIEQQQLYKKLEEAIEGTPI